jgi:hypothetical protein
MRYLVFLVVLIGCGKSDAQKRREVQLCIVAASDATHTDPYAVGWCLENRFAWDDPEAVQRVQNQVAVAERQSRAAQDSIRKARRRK